MMRPIQDYDGEIQALVAYLNDSQQLPEQTLVNARYNLIDSIACMLMALQFDAAKRHLGPMPGCVNLEHGVRVPGTSYRLDPVKAAWDIGALVRWLDFNDTWLAAEWGHPSDNWGAVLALGDYLSLNAREFGADLSVHQLLQMIVKAHEIQGVLALENSLNRVGLDHVMWVKLASSGVCALMLGLNEAQIAAVLSHAVIDGQSLRTYRHAPNTMSRKSWAAGDAASRALRLAFIVKNGEDGIISPLKTPTWGFYDAQFKGNAFKFQRPYGHYIMDHILYKISFPAEFHAQTAVECAFQLHPKVADKLDSIERIEILTQEPAVRIIDKEGPLHNPADRDHCIQYMVAIGLIFGTLTAEHYEDEYAADKRIDALRAKMVVREQTAFTQDYYDPNKRAIANAVQIFFADGSSSDRVQVDYPIGHPMRRKEGIPLLMDKFERAIEAHYAPHQAHQVHALLTDHQRLLQTPVHEMMTALALHA